MEGKKSPWARTPEEEVAIDAARAESKEQEKKETMITSTLEDMQSQLEAFIAEKQLVVKSQATEGAFTIATVENNTFDRLGDKIDELVGFANDMLSQQGHTGYLVLDRHTDRRILHIRSVA